MKFVKLLRITYRIKSVKNLKKGETLSSKLNHV